MDQRVLKWFGHMRRSDVQRTARSVPMAEIIGGRANGRPRLGSTDVVSVVSCSSWG